MIELGELEKKHAEFAKRHVRLIAISNDEQTDAQTVQARFLHVTVISDREQNIARAMQVIHEGASIDGTDTNAPTVFLVDEAGYVRWWGRPQRFSDRFSPEELLEAIDGVK